MVFGSGLVCHVQKRPDSFPALSSTSHVSPLTSPHNDHFIREQHFWNSTSSPKSVVLFSSGLEVNFPAQLCLQCLFRRSAPTRRHLRQQCQRYSRAKLLLPFRRYSRLCLFLHHSQALRRADPSSLLRSSAKLPRTSPAFLGKEFESYEFQTSYY